MSIEFPPVGGSSVGSAQAAGVHTRSSGAHELYPLPAPRHLQEYLTRSQHLHLGYFENAAESLGQAQDRLIVRTMRLLPRNALVADVGCGLGGAANLLAAQGHRVYGFDPCSASIAYARTRATSARARFLVADLAEFTVRARGARFDALFLTEVLPHFRDLGAFFASCRALLRPGGLVLVHDIVRLAGRATREPGTHARGALRVAADAAGFDLQEARDVTNRTSPTLPRLARLLVERRDELVLAFGPARAIQLEIDAYHQRLHALELAFAHQELAYETSVLRCSTRFGTDSVVLRTHPRAAVVPTRRVPPS